MPKVKPDGATVFISNISEDVWTFIQSMTDPKLRQYEILENSFLSDRDLYSISKIPNSFFIAPQPFDPDFFEYVTAVTQADNVNVLVPKKHSGEVCLDCIDDKKLFQQLVAVGKERGALTLLSYSATAQFYDLVEALEKAGVVVKTPDSPSFEDVWTVNFFGSKTGIRQLVEKYEHLNKNLIMAQGMMCSGIDQIAEVAAHKYFTEGAVVIKTNKGHSGAGVLIYKPGELPKDFDECLDQIEATLKKDEYWAAFPVVIESFVPPDFTIGGGFPNVECRVHEKGEVEVLYFCGMRMSGQGVFHGVEIKDDVLSAPVRKKFAQIGQFLGMLYAQQGYRGYFDIDFIAGADGKLYLTESNVRRTGGTYAYEASMRLIGKDFMSIYSASNSGYPIKPKKEVTFKQLKELLEPVLFDPKTHQGIVLTTANALKQNKVGYIVFGKSKKIALEIEEKMHGLLKKL